MRFTPIAAFLLALAASFPAPADDERLPPITSSAVRDECGACHMAFQPQFLPRRSWQRIMDGLADHFGEDASLPDGTRREITAYLLANAADTSRSREGRRFAASNGRGEPPLRITEMPRWVAEHRGEVRPSAWNSPRVGSKANCPACHRGANDGYYDDD